MLAHERRSPACYEAGSCVYTMKLEDDKYCFACGEKNSHGLHLKFALDSNILSTEFIPQKHHQGFKNIVHGGIIGLVLDEVMVNLLWKLEIHAISAELSVRLKKPAKVGEKIFFKGWICKETDKIIYTEAEAKDEKGAVIATANAKCVLIKRRE